MASDEQSRRERNLDRAVGLAHNGRIKPDEIIEMAKEFDEHLAGH